MDRQLAFLSRRAALFAVVLAIALGVPSRAAAGPVHLYVAASVRESTHAVYRYPVVNGVPTLKPDQTIDNLLGPVAASPLGGMSDVWYAQLGNGTIAAFANGGTSPSREIALPKLQGSNWLVIGLAVDRDGYLYVGATQQPNRQEAPQPSNGYPANAIFIFDPAANGRARPVQIVWQGQGSFDTFALGPRGELYVLGETGFAVDTCVVIADPRTRPHAIGSFQSHQLGTSFGAAVFENDLYVSTFINAKPFYQVDVFAVTSRGTVSPSRLLSAAAGSLTGFLAIFDGILYVAASDNTNALWLFYANASGSVSPFAGHSYALGTSGVAIGQ